MTRIITILFFILLLVKTQAFSQQDSSINFQFDINSLKIGNELYTDLKPHIDSVIYWNYDILSINKDSADSNLLCTIIFFRNEPIPDSIFEKEYGKRFIPMMTFSVYPIFMEFELAKRQFDLSIISNGKLAGTTAFKTKNFIFFQSPFYEFCYTSDYKTDYCRENINRFTNFTKSVEYKSIEQLLTDLPIKRKEYK
jgi:hypothetical protein